MIAELINQVSGDRIREHIRLLEGVRQPYTAPEVLEQGADYIHTSLSSLGYKIKQHFFSVGGREFRNIVATHPGILDPEHRLLIVAHYDTVVNSPGADDNTSGIALLLELARVLQPVHFDRTVQFIAVNLEEQLWKGPFEETGLFGSRALAAEAEKESWQIEGVIVLESVAYAGERIIQKSPEGIPVKLPAFGDFIAIVGNDISKELVEHFVRNIELYDIPLPVETLVVPGNGEMLPDTRRSDHSPFWEKGFKAVMVTDTANFRNPNYHQPTDTLETLNIAFAVEVCRAVIGVITDVAKYASAT